MPTTPAAPRSLAHRSRRAQEAIEDLAVQQALLRRPDDRGVGLGGRRGPFASQEAANTFAEIANERHGHSSTQALAIVCSSMWPAKEYTPSGDAKNPIPSGSTLDQLLSPTPNDEKGGA